MLTEILEQYYSLDNQLYIHSKNVAFYSFMLAKQISLEENLIITVVLGGLLHDIGKSMINASILRKPSKLTREEFLEIKKHCEHGSRILSSYTILKDLLPIVKFHHERWDGFGYYGLKGTECELKARIVCIADSFDAMTSPRPYQKSKNMKETVEELSRCSGTQFDPHLVNEFFKALVANCDISNYIRFEKIIKNHL